MELLGLNIAARSGKNRPQSQRNGARVRYKFECWKKKLGLTLVSAQEERGRVYRVAAPEQA